MVSRALSCLCLASLALIVSSCSTSPTAPSPAVDVDGQRFAAALSCPASVEVIINDQNPEPVLFPRPTIVGVGEVTKSSCTAASGSSFPVGTTAVTCSAYPAEDLVASCSFSVTVLSRLLRLTDFLAFGDSITTGVFSSNFSLATTSGISTSYPAQLEALLMERYPDQPITIINTGLAGETSPEGRARAPRVLGAWNPEVMMLLEGINDLLNIGPAQTANDLEAIARSAQSRGVLVLIATLTPIGDSKASGRSGIRAAADDLNQRIRQIARDLNLGPVVDLFGAFDGRPSLLGDDGLHPTADGYRVMAEEFMDAIVSRFEEVEGQ